MMRESTMPQKISLQEKRVYVPTHMILELIIHVSVHEYIILTFEVGSSSATPNINETHVIQEPDVPNAVIDEEEDQPQNLENNVSNQENVRRSQRIRKSDISDDYEIYTSEEIHMEGDPTSYEVAMKNPHSSKWREAMEDEIRSMSANQV
jgi:hypothetical protein